jgi:hypothetical protein
MVFVPKSKIWLSCGAISSTKFPQHLSRHSSCPASRAGALSRAGFIHLPIGSHVFLHLLLPAPTSKSTTMDSTAGQLRPPLRGGQVDARSSTQHCSANLTWDFACSSSVVRKMLGYKWKGARPAHTRSWRPSAKASQILGSTPRHPSNPRTIVNWAHPHQC